MSCSCHPKSRQSKSGSGGLRAKQCEVDSPVAHRANRLAAFPFEFVTKPEQSANAVSHLPAAIRSGLEDIAGFAASLDMVCDQEARRAHFLDGQRTRAELRPERAPCPCAARPLTWTAVCACKTCSRTSPSSAICQRRRAFQASLVLLTRAL